MAGLHCLGGAVRPCTFSSAPARGARVGAMPLEPCPDSPNCVSTQADPKDADHFMEPVTYTADLAVVVQAIEGAISGAGGTVVSAVDQRVEAIFTTKFLKFKDDVHFELDDDAKLIHFRSASRVGYSDLGANRKRMDALLEEIRVRIGS